MYMGVQFGAKLGGRYNVQQRKFLMILHDELTGKLDVGDGVKGIHIEWYDGSMGLDVHGVS